MNILEYICPNCDGRGYIIDPSFHRTIDCPTCLGRGMLSALEFAEWLSEQDWKTTLWDAADEYGESITTAK